MKDVRIKQTENEKLMTEALGTNVYGFNLSENSIDKVLQREKASKFNSEVDSYLETLESNNDKFQESQGQVGYDINKAEIKPMFSRVIIKPFEVNPFQKMEVKGNLIVDAGGYTPHIQKNEMTGKYEEQKQFIVTGCVIEVGPDTKYLREGDVIYYRVDTAVPVPFFKQGFISLDEKQIIAVVNEGLSERFNNIK